MSTALLYLLKVNGLLLFFWLFYRMFLKKETFYSFNRWYFLTTIAAAFIFPLVTFTQTIRIEEKPAVEIPIFHVNEQSSVPVKMIDQEPGLMEMFQWQDILFYTLSFTGIVLILICIFKISLLFFTIRRLPEIKGTNIRITNKEHNVYSFYQWIVVPENIFNWPDYQMVIDHENVHLNQKHTLDLILIELVAKVFWFNPLIKYFQKDLNINLEFLVDDIMVQKHEAVSYQKSLLFVRNRNHLTFTNAFSSSDLRKRIVQLNTLKSNPMKKFKILITAPILLLFFSAFQTETVAQVIRFSEQESFSDAFTIDPDFSKKDLQSLKQDLKTRFGINLVINKVKYKNGKINYLKYTLKKNSYKISGAVNANDAIKPLTITVNEGNREIPFSVEEHQGNSFHAYSFTTKGLSDTETKKDSDRSTLFFLNDKKSTKDEIADLDPKKIVSVHIDKNKTTINGADVSEDGIIRIVTTDGENGKTASEISLKDLTQDKNSFKKISNMYMVSVDDIEFDEDQLEKLDPKTIKSIYKITGANTKGKKAVLHLSTGNTNRKPLRTILLEAQNNVKEKGDGKLIISNGSATFNSVTALSLDIDKKQSFLYVIDGKEVSKEDFSKIEAKKIKNISILKDDSATKKYGDKAKEGVIEVTTGEPISFRDRAEELKNREWAVQIRKQNSEKRKQLLSERKRIIENRKKELENEKKIRLQKAENS